MHALLPLLTRLPQPLPRRQHTDNNNSLDAPISQTIDRRARRGARRDDRVDDDGELGQIGAGGREVVVGQVVVVLHGLESGLFAVETQVVDRDGGGEERGERGDHGEAGAEDGDEGDAGGRGGGGGCGVGVAEGGFVGA